MTHLLADDEHFKRLIDSLGQTNCEEPPAGSLPFILNGRRCGTVVPEAVKRIKSALTLLPNTPLVITDKAVIVDVIGGDVDAALARLAKQCFKAGLFFQWRNELLDLIDPDTRRVLAHAERGLFRLLGLTTMSVYVVGMSEDGRMWTGLRSHTKHVDPGMWDTLAAGMIASGETVAEAAMRELSEEAGLSQNDVRPVGQTLALTMRRAVPEGWMHEIAFCRRYVVRNGAHVHNVDGEVETFELVSIDEMLERIRARRVPSDTGLVMLLTAVKPLLRERAACQQ
ncbi:MAG: NUDIX domain-containing protein [Duodenibacillus sp.]